VEQQRKYETMHKDEGEEHGWVRSRDFSRLYGYTSFYEHRYVFTQSTRGHRRYYGDHEVHLGIETRPRNNRRSIPEKRPAALLLRREKLFDLWSPQYFLFKVARFSISITETSRFASVFEIRGCILYV